MLLVAEAFKEGGVVYNGGPVGAEQPGVVVHGRGDVLGGCEEIAPGTRIYTGGLEDACRLLKAKKQTKPGMLEQAVEDLVGSSAASRTTEASTSAPTAAAAAAPGPSKTTTDVLDYRLFVGKRKWEARELEGEVARGLWQPVACARPIALKQCLALPKPLWHEVMELVGGPCAELSKFEFMRRDDLQDE